MAGTFKDYLFTFAEPLSSAEHQGESKLAPPLSPFYTSTILSRDIYTGDSISLGQISLQLAASFLSLPYIRTRSILQDLGTDASIIAQACNVSIATI